MANNDKEILININKQIAELVKEQAPNIFANYNWKNVEITVEIAAQQSNHKWSHWTQERFNLFEGVK